MKEQNLHEWCIEQIHRLFAPQMYNDSFLQFDEAGRVRIDDWELREDIQTEVARRWSKVNSDNLDELSDYKGYQQEFLKLFGFNIPGIDYEVDVDPVALLPNGKL